MPIPDYQAVMLPLLQWIGDHGSINRGDAAKMIADVFHLSETERYALIPSGRMTVIRSRASWARTYLKKAGLIEYPQRGMVRITARGKQVLSENLKSIDLQYLRRFPEFENFYRASSKDTGDDLETESPIHRTPDETLESIYFQRRGQLLSEILEKIKSCSPQFFENLVVDVIVSMGYGGSRKDAGQAIGRSGDEGIDGIINEDRLGLDVIYLQAKKWEANIGRPEVQKFAGALQGKRAKKGIFITTSDFTEEARKYVQSIEARIILVSGRYLAELMWDHNIGLTTVESYQIKDINTDYFIE